MKIELSAAKFENVIFRNNHGSRTVFDALWAENLIIRNCKFYYNIAEFNPCIHVNGQNILIEKCIFFQNSAENNGSIIDFGSKNKIKGCTITNNYLNNNWYSAVFKYGNGFSNPNPQSFTSIENTLVTNNFTLNVFHHVDSIFPMPQFNHCNHWNNAGNDWTGYIANQFGQNGNITGNPLYIDTLNLDYQIQWGSPCIDAGNPLSTYDPDGTIADIGYYYRPQYTSIDEINLQESISLFPNPTKNIITIYTISELPNAGIIRIYQLNGQQVMEENFQNQRRVELDITKIPNGIYFLKIQDKEGMLVKKLVKQ